MCPDCVASLLPGAGQVVVGGFPTWIDLDLLVEHPLGGCFVCGVGLPLDVIERGIEQRP